MATFSVEDIANTIHKLPRCQAPDAQGLTAVILLAVDEKFFTPILKGILNNIDSIGFPTPWMIKHVVPLHKVGNKNDPFNYKCIMISSVFSKLYAQMLEKLLSQLLLHKRRKEDAVAVRGPQGILPGHKSQDQPNQNINCDLQLENKPHLAPLSKTGGPTSYPLQQLNSTELTLPSSPLLVGCKKGALSGQGPHHATIWLYCLGPQLISNKLFILSMWKDTFNYCAQAAIANLIQLDTERARDAGRLVESGWNALA
ncbi:hypothetical protein SELMODRAFT_410537 [Selaginella moellendorffii]|uniref:Reverse transcriptase domain-containing protein n=1 Tax=Selaginella moellendorffii TaxID=88036 RepID=D8RF24_SELML|nr:hypothetical protein SELMODRAFT_410537 [Selaginella moellendorffii]